MPSLTYVGAHAETTRLEPHQIVRQLNDHLGPTLVAALAGSKARSAPYRWAKPLSDGGVEPRTEAAQRLQAAHTIWILIAAAENDHVARAWFIGSNPRLGNIAPVMVIRDGRLKEALDAAEAFIEGTDD